METLSSKEYADIISQTTNEKELQESYEANLMAMGKDMPYQLEDAYKQGKVNAIKHVMEVYKSVREHYSHMEGLTFEVFDVMLAEAVNQVLEEI